MEDHNSENSLYEHPHDPISRLPCNVVSKIFSHLTTREAVRTCVLSTKWRYLWTKSLSRLTFDAQNMLDQEEYSNIDLLYSSDFHRLIIPPKRAIAFLYSVHQFLTSLNHDQNIEKLKVHFRFHCHQHVKHLDNWISFAVQRGVKELDIDLTETDYPSFVPSIPGYDFPCDLAPDSGTRNRMSMSLKCLRLTYCRIVAMSGNFLGFSSVTRLDLKQIHFTSNESLHGFLSSCGVLERLSLSECYGFYHIKIVQQMCARLKHLEVNDCQDLKTIEITGINLDRFEYKGERNVNFVFNN